MKSDCHLALAVWAANYEALLGSKLKYKLCYGVKHFIRPHGRIMFQRLIELCSALFSYVRKFRLTTQILFGW